MPGRRNGEIMKKLLAALKMESRLFLRDFYGSFFTFVFPLLMLLLYGGIYGNQPSTYFNGMGAMDVSVPAYCVMIIGVTGLMAFPLTLAGYKENQIYKRFDATPAGKGTIILAQVLVNFLMTLAGFALLLLAGRLIYNIRIVGGFFPIMGALLLCIASIFSLGFFFTAIAPNIKISSLLCYISYFVMIFLSGATMPRTMFPQALKKISDFLPMTYAVNLLQGSFRGENISAHTTDLLVLSALLVLCTSLGALFYQKKSWV